MSRGRSGPGRSRVRGEAALAQAEFTESDDDAVRRLVASIRGDGNGRGNGKLIGVGLAILVIGQVGDFTTIRQRLVANGIVPPLLAILASADSDEELQLWAAGCMDIITETLALEDMRRLLSEGDVLRTLAEVVVRSPSSMASMYATAAITRIVKVDCDRAVDVFELGLLPTLVAMLEHSGTPSSNSAVYLLRQLTLHPATFAQIRATTLSVLPTLIHALRHDACADTRHCAHFVMRQLSGFEIHQDDASCAEFIRSGALEAMVSVLSVGHRDRRELAGWTCYFIYRTFATHVAVNELLAMDVASAVANVLRSPASCFVRKYVDLELAAIALMYLVRSAGAEVDLLGLVPRLVRLMARPTALHDPDSFVGPHVLRLACTILLIRAIRQHERPALVAMLEAGVLPALMDMLACAKLDLHAEAGVDLLFMLMPDPSIFPIAGVLRATATAIANMLGGPPPATPPILAGDRSYVTTNCTLGGNARPMTEADWNRMGLILLSWLLSSGKRSSARQAVEGGVVPPLAAVSRRSGPNQVLATRLLDTLRRLLAQDEAAEAQRAAEALLAEEESLAVRDAARRAKRAAKRRLKAARRDDRGGRDQEPDGAHETRQAQEQEQENGQDARPEGADDEQLKDEYDDDDDDDPSCAVCMDNDKCTTLIPCGHRELCRSCCDSILASSASKCPICRQDIDTTLDDAWFSARARTYTFSHYSDRQQIRNT